MRRRLGGGRGGDEEERGRTEGRMEMYDYGALPGVPTVIRWEGFGWAWLTFVPSFFSPCGFTSKRDTRRPGDIPSD